MQTYKYKNTKIRDKAAECSKYFRDTDLEILDIAPGSFKAFCQKQVKVDYNKRVIHEAIHSAMKFYLNIGDEDDVSSLRIPFTNSPEILLQWLNQFPSAEHYINQSIRYFLNNNKLGHLSKGLWFMVGYSKQHFERSIYTEVLNYLQI